MFDPSLLTFGNLENRQEMSKDLAAVLTLRRAVLGAGGGWGRVGQKWGCRGGGACGRLALKVAVVAGVRGGQRDFSKMHIHCFNSLTDIQ